MAFRVLCPNFLCVSRILQQSVRTRKKGPRPEKYYEDLQEKLYPDAYCLESYGMKYYPRDPNYKDPPYEPSKLLMIRRVKGQKGVPWYDRKILEKYGIGEMNQNIVKIVMNTPEINRDLWKIKYLISVKPVTFPNGEPSTADINRTYLKQNGEMLVSDLVAADPERIEAQKNLRNNPYRMDGWTLKCDSRRRWLSGC